MSVLYLLLLFIVKHFVCDFLLQFPRHYLNKGRYWAWGGIEHALIHGVGTLLVLNPVAALVDMLVHYHIDWAKMNINRYYKLTPTNSENFWRLLGLDQTLHLLTYIGLVWAVELGYL